MAGKSGYYHVMIRSNERKNIFFNNKGKQRLIETINQMKAGGRFELHTF